MSEQESIGAAAPFENDVETLLQAELDRLYLQAQPKLAGALALLVDWYESHQGIDGQSAVGHARYLLESLAKDLDDTSENIDLAALAYSRERKAGVQRLLEPK